MVSNAGAAWQGEIGKVNSKYLKKVLISIFMLINTYLKLALILC